MYLTGYILFLFGLALNAPAELFDPSARAFVLIVGVVGIWRYGWGAVHFVRAIYYKSWRFPRFRRASNNWLSHFSDAPLEKPPVYLVITAFRIPIPTLRQVFEAAIAEAISYGAPVTIVASIVEMGDQRMIKQLFAQWLPPDHVQLVLTRISGSGKRDGLATALMAIARRGPRNDAAVVVMDGDAVLPIGALDGTVPFLQFMPDIGGITTDEDAIVRGSNLLNQWHRLRFAQRQLLMCSMGLSKRLLTMTGRMSVYRASIATDPSFIAQIRDDAIDHWRFGRIKLVTGEDKSTWFWLLKNGIGMLYVPDVRIMTIEHPPADRFMPAATQLMMRWFGNMLRAGNRAIELGPNRVGAFAWWCLVDQRLSMWTPLIGPIAAICLAIIASPVFLYAYLMWVMATRLLLTLMLWSVRDTISGLYPWLIYFNQIYGALVKTYALFRPNRQRWTRQQTKQETTRAGWLTELGSIYVHSLAMLALFALIGLLTGLLPWPSDITLTALN